MITLGIETSCDETALALLESRQNGDIFEYRVLSSLVHSQADLHSQYGGVYPNLAKREHGKNLFPLLEKLLNDSKDFININDQLTDEQFQKKIDEISSLYNNQNPDLVSSLKNAQFFKTVPSIDNIAVTEGPGLEPALWVGITFAQILNNIWSRNDGLISVNHMEGHILGSLLEEKIENGKWYKLKQLQFPALALLISGGHTEIVQIEKDSFLKYKIIGQTKDDAVGEAFDKVARLLGLPYPGGPKVSQLAEMARENNVVSNLKLPRPMIKTPDLDFSFSGLKTAVLYAVRDQEEKGGKLDENFKISLAKEFEDAIVEVLTTKLKRAIEETQSKSLIIGGGVIANNRLRNSFEKLAGEYDIPIYLPSKHVSGDNALMIALAGTLNRSDQSHEPKAHGTKRLD